MPHDMNGRIVEVGSIINIPCRVKSITLDENYCNLTVETLHSMAPYENNKNIYTLNAKQVELRLKES